MKKPMQHNHMLRAGVIGALMTGLMYAGHAQAELTFNVGAFTDYIDNGESVSNNHAVVQGGVEYVHSGGLFLGVQVSTLGGKWHGAGGGSLLWGGVPHGAFGAGNRL
ncbi:protein of unknown function (Gcw_chp) [Ectothiorhodospira magna]|uniref:Uncharacterized protein n=1 Tax=Ectothiorhodospira magna TaxID=867345 RepID=A0A1H8ZZ96_9GAMM|nr:TorF family putative porin [Ectothiorhodospira magna]SEP69068.1 protein of unknown function (Gcw_chp) [Ectothiorhodospira magna]